MKKYFEASLKCWLEIFFDFLKSGRMNDPGNEFFISENEEIKEKNDFYWSKKFILQNSADYLPFFIENSFFVEILKFVKLFSVETFILHSQTKLQWPFNPPLLPLLAENPSLPIFPVSDFFSQLHFHLKNATLVSSSFMHA